MSAAVENDGDAKTAQTIWGRFKEFNTIWDSRFEDLKWANWGQTVYRDFSAGLIVALTAIPMAMGFSMAMGLRPEQGIIAGALACLIGRTFGGSKYQVYGPTAAFIPVIAALMAKYGEAGGGTFAQAHGFLVLVSIIAGVILMIMGLFGLGKYAKLVPNSIIVGFTVGIAVAIAASNIESVLGLKSFGDLLGEDANVPAGLEHTLASILGNLNKINFWAVAIGLFTFGFTKLLLRVSIFIPAPAIAIGLCTLAASTILSDTGIVMVRDIYGKIPSDFFVFTGPFLPAMNMGVAFDIFYFVVAIVFVSGVESLLCSSMADRLANNKGTPFNPNKEFWGQGLVQVFTPLLNGFPCTGALARTATSIKAGAVTPLAGLVLKPWGNVSLYANYIEGLSKGDVAPATASNAGQVFKPYKAKQKEVGVKVDFDSAMLTLSAFEITKPSGQLTGSVYAADSEQRNRGLELNLSGEPLRGLRLLGGVTFLDAELTRTSNPATRGNRPVGVPRFTANLGAEWDTPWVAGLTLTGGVIHTGKEYVNQANTQSVPSWTTFDLGARYVTRIDGKAVTLRANVVNLFNRAYWSGVASYGTLSQGVPRTLMLSASMDF